MLLKLTFNLNDDVFIDGSTGTIWSKKGFAIDCPLKGKI
jgi:hypothetical protein